MSSDTSESYERVTITLPSGGQLFVTRFTDGVNDEVTYTAGFQSMDLGVEVSFSDGDGDGDDEDAGDDETGVYPEHNNDIGDWCPWSGEPRQDKRCPAGCRQSA